MPFGLSTVAIKAIGIGLAVLALLAGFAWFVHREQEVGAQKVRDEVAAATAVQKAADDAETQRRLTAQQEIVRDVQLQASTARADAARADGARNALRVQLAGFVAANRRAASSPASAGSAPATDALDVLADVFSRADQRAGELAKLADDRGVAGLACQRSYDALSQGKP